MPPTMKPPRWPPAEMPGTTKVMRKLTAARVRRLLSRSRRPRSRAITSAAPSSANAAPEAPTVYTLGDDSAIAPTEPPRMPTR